MAKHQKPPEDSEGDGETQLDAIELAKLLDESGGAALHRGR
ncbi:MAG TPA: hypothetical protein VE196_13940 [Pseudonocardiaceae bacterium]|nr:hypothetical protein [Pseudonocardiaceae bacterium]